MKKSIQRMSILLLSIAVVFSVQAQLESFSAYIELEEFNIFYEDVAVTPDDDAYVLLSQVTPAVNRYTPIISKINREGFEIWQKKIVHSELDLYPESMVRTSDGDLIFAMTDYDNQDGFLGSNTLMIRTNSEGEVIQGVRVGNAQSQLVQSMMLLDDDRIALVIHHGGSSGYGSVICILDAEDFSVLSSQNIEGGQLTYLDRIIPLDNGQYVGVGSEIELNSPSTSLFLLFDSDFNVLKSKSIAIPNLRSVATYATYQNDQYTIYLDVENEGVSIQLDQDFNMIESKKIGFLTINDHYVHNGVQYLFSASQNSIIAYENGEAQYCKILGGEHASVELFEPAADQMHVWGLNNRFKEGRWGTQITRRPLSNVYTCGTFYWDNPMPVDFNLTMNDRGVTVNSVDFITQDETQKLSSQPSTINNEVTCTETVVSTSDDFKEITLSIAPNPVADQVILSSPISKATLYNMSGQIVAEWSGVLKTLDVSRLKSGLYVLTTDLGTIKLAKL